MFLSGAAFEGATVAGAQSWKAWEASSNQIATGLLLHSSLALYVHMHLPTKRRKLLFMIVRGVFSS